MRGMRWRFLGWGVVAAAALLLGACADVAFQEGRSQLDGKSLVFGRMLLDREGERSVLSVSSTVIRLRKIDRADEPGQVTQPFEDDGRFYWALPPGRYQLGIALSPLSDGLKTYGFTVDRAGSAYYVGDLVFKGKKSFVTFFGANVKNPVTEFVDDFDRARAELLARNPQLQAVPVQRLALRDLSLPEHRWAAYREAMDAGQACCARLAELPFEPMALPDKRSFAVGPASPLFDFPSGRSRFVAVQLPETASPYGVHVRSVVTPGIRIGDFNIFSPAVMFLDRNFQVLANEEQGVFAPVPAAVFPPQSASVQARIAVTGPIQAAKYMILYTTKDILLGKWTTWRPGAILVPGGALPGLPVLTHMEPAISGHLEVRIEPLPQ